MSGAFRLTSPFNGDLLDKVAVEWVDMEALDLDVPKEAGDAVGLWAEVRDRNGTVLYRQLAEDPFLRYVEVFASPDETGSRIHRELVKEVNGYLVVVVPDIDGSTSLVLARVAASADGKELERHELADVALSSGKSS